MILLLGVQVLACLVQVYGAVSEGGAVKDDAIAVNTCAYNKGYIILRGSAQSRYSPDYTHRISPRRAGMSPYQPECMDPWIWVATAAVRVGMNPVAIGVGMNPHTHSYGACPGQSNADRPGHHDAE